MLNKLTRYFFLSLLSFPALGMAGTCSDGCTVKVSYLREEILYQEFGLFDGVFCANLCRTQTLTHSKGLYVINLAAGANFCVRGPDYDGKMVSINQVGPEKICERESNKPSTVKVLKQDIKFWKATNFEPASGALLTTELHGNLLITLKSGEHIECHSLDLQTMGFIDGTTGCSNGGLINMKDIAQLEQEEPALN